MAKREAGGLKLTEKQVQAILDIEQKGYCTELSASLYPPHRNLLAAGCLQKDEKFSRLVLSELGRKVVVALKGNVDGKA